MSKGMAGAACQAIWGNSHRVKETETKEKER